VRSILNFAPAVLTVRADPQMRPRDRAADPVVLLMRRGADRAERAGAPHGSGANGRRGPAAGLPVTCWSAAAGRGCRRRPGRCPGEPADLGADVVVVAGDHRRDPPWADAAAGWSCARAGRPSTAPGPRHCDRRPRGGRGRVRGGRGGPSVGQQRRRSRPLLVYDDVGGPAGRRGRRLWYGWAQPRAGRPPAPSPHRGAKYEILLDHLSEAREGRATGRSTEDADWQRAFDQGIVDLVRAGRVADAKELLKSCL
jgi:hypothetical protein